MLEKESCCSTEFQIFILRSLLHYHERMTMGTVTEVQSGKDLCNNLGDGKCAKIIFQDAYAETLREAIRCIEIVHKDALSGG